MNCAFILGACLVPEFTFDTILCVHDICVLSVYITGGTHELRLHTRRMPRARSQF